MPIDYSADHPLGFSGSVSQATGSSATELPLATTEGLPNLAQDDYVYAVVRNKAGLRELVKITAIDRSLHRVTVERGVFGAPVVLDQGSDIDVANDRKTIVEAIQLHGGGGGEEGGLSRPQVQALIKGFARSGSSDKVRFSDIESTGNLNEADTRSFDNQRFVVSDGQGQIDGFLEGSDLRGELEGADVPDNRQIPPGGRRGQALKKSADTDYAVSWQDDQEGSTATGVTPEQASDIESAKDFEAALRQDVPLATNETVTQAASNAAERIPNGKALPAAEADDELIWTVDTHTIRIKAQTLRDKAQASNGAQLNDANSIRWQPESGGDIYRLAYEAGGAPLFAVDNIGSHTVSLVYSRIDIESAARQSSNAAWTRAKLPSDLRELPAYPSVNPATQILYGDGTWKVAPSGGTGVSEARVDQLIDTRIPDSERVPQTGPDAGVLTRLLSPVRYVFQLVQAANVKLSTLTFGGNLIKGNQQAMGPDDNLQSAFQKFNDYKPPLKDLPANVQTVANAVEAGGWRQDVSVTVSPFRSATYTLAQALGLAYVQQLPEHGTRLTNQNIVVRVERTLFDRVPLQADRERIRVRLDSGAEVVVSLDSGSYLGHDNAENYDFWNCAVPDLPAASIPTAEYNAPVELDIHVAAEDIVGQIRGSSAGLIPVFDGSVTGISVPDLRADHNGTPQAFTPEFSVATGGENEHGILQLSATLSIGTTSETLSFTDNQTSTTITITGSVFASTLRALATFVRQTGMANAIRWGRGEVYAVSSGSYTRIGLLPLYLVVDASKQVRFLWDYRDDVRHSENESASFGAHLRVDFQRQDGGSGGGTSTPAPRSVLTRESLTSAVTLADPTQNEVSSTAWTDIFSHTVTSAEGSNGLMHVGATVFATLTLTTAGDATTSPDRGGDRPLLVIRLVKGTEEQGRNYRYFRFSGGVPLDCIISETISVAANDSIKVQAQMSRLTAAGTTLGASVTAESHWERLSLR